MRTRDEQAKSLRDSLCADYVSAPVHEAGYELAMRHIEEAELRAEQRVRAEIARDSERLDWLAGAIQEIRISSNRPTQWIVGFNKSVHSLDRDNIRSAIDAAREVG